MAVVVAMAVVEALAEADHSSLEPTAVAVAVAAVLAQRECWDHHHHRESFD